MSDCLASGSLIFRTTAGSFRTAEPERTAAATRITRTYFCGMRQGYELCVDLLA